MTPAEELKVRLIELLGSLEPAQAAFEWVVDAPAPAPVPAQVTDGVLLLDDEVLKMDAEALKEAAMLRLAAKQNAGAEVK